MAQWRNTSLAYGIVARGFHWLMALMIIGMLCVGFYMDGLPMSPDKLRFYGLHKATGVLILALVSLRLLWRAANPVPALPSDMPVWQRWGAHLSHYGLYGLMFAMPLIGWTMSSAAGIPVSVFGWFSLPHLIGPSKELVDLTKALHFYGALALIALISAHAGAALYHHFIRKDTILKRMLPW